MKTYVAASAGRASLLATLVVCAIGSQVFAQALPAPWTAIDIGSPLPPGSATYASGIFTLTAGGADIWGASDQFRFIYQQVAGDADIVARVDSLGAAAPWSKAGVMIRGSLDAGSAHGYAVVSASRGIGFHRRTSTGAISVATAGPASAAPVWLRATRVGTRVTAYYSANGSSWTAIGSDTIALGTTAYIGIAVTSHNSTAVTTARVSNAAVFTKRLPTGQAATDIGGPAVAGATLYNAGTYRITAAGTDIWDTADQFHFVYQPVTGDLDVTTRVTSVTRAQDWSKAGVMVRESLSATSRHASVFVSAAKGYAFQRRLDPGVYSVHTAGGVGTTPGWVRLVRRGNLFEAYRSADGSAWTRIGSDTVAMGATVYVGLAVTSHNAGVATAVEVDNLRIAGSTSGNQPPAVSLIAPVAGGSYVAPATVTLTAAASDPEGRMASVDFYVGSTLLARDSTAPYAASWSPTSPGTYALSAVAHDADGFSTTSATVSVVVTTPATSTPPRLVVFTASADHATNVSSYRFDVFNAGANPATATAVATASLGKPAPDTNNDITSDQSTLFRNLAAGNYIATVTAIGPGGSTRSVALAFTR